MPLLGPAALLLSFDVEAAAIDEHDQWHTQEHLPERLSIPGFLRGTRWTIIDGAPRYMVLYEVESLETLSSAAYLDRLNNPSPWTQKMMPHYRGMSRGLCRVIGSVGAGLGGFAALVRFADAEGWLPETALETVPQMAGLGSAHLLQAAQGATMTNEQRIRGADHGMGCAAIVMGYEEAAVSSQARSLRAELGSKGATQLSSATYQLAYSLENGQAPRR